MEALDRSAPASPAGAEKASRRLLWAAMIPAVAMIFIDQTVVAIAVPEIQKDLALSSTGIQWVITGYLVSLAALIAFGGRLGDMLGHRRMVIVGVTIFAVSSLLCGLTPEGSEAEAWLVVFRIVQGAGAALLFPAALTLVMNAYPAEQRGRAVAMFFVAAGLFTAVGPIAGGYLSEWTWRAIFWINVPVAILALALTVAMRSADRPQPVRIGLRELALLVAGMGALVLGLQQSSQWGWDSPATWGCIVAGVVLLGSFVRVERSAAEPLIRVRLFQRPGFLADSVMLMLAFGLTVPIFFFASMYSQISLGYSVGNAGLYLAVFFGGWALGNRWGGKLLDRVGVRQPVLIGAAVAAAGLFIWGSQATDLSLGSQWYGMVLAGAGVGLIASPSNTDAFNRVPLDAHGEAIGILMTFRNFGASVGLAVLGTVLITTMHDKLDAFLATIGVPAQDAEALNRSLSQTGGGESNPLAGVGDTRAEEVLDALQRDFAEATQLVLYIMAAVMAVALLVAFAWVRNREAAMKGPPVEASTGPVA